MKYLISFLLVLISSFSSYAELVQKELKCSRAGTDILLVNGISWGRKSVEYILYKQIEPSIPKSYVDNKTPAGSFVKFKYSYNHSNGFLRDMLESAVQKVSQNFNVSPNNAFVAAYYFTYKGVVAGDFIESIFKDKKITFSSISNYLISYFNPNTLDKMVQDSFNTNVKDTIKLKASISSTLLSGKKLILITESQGNFFGKQAIQDFLNGENLNFAGKTGRLNDYLGTIGQLQIAPPTGSLLPKNKVVLNNKDIINLVFFERPSSNFTLVPPSPDLRSQEIDRIINHFITSTYLNDENMTTGNLSALRNFTLQSIVNLASSLESNCQNAVINSTNNNLVVNFDATDPQDPNVTGLRYSWNFGDGQAAFTESKTVSHTYAKAGTYQVSLTLFDLTGQVASTATEVQVTVPEKSIFVHINPKATYLFTDTSNKDNPDVAIPATQLDLGPLFTDPELQLMPGDLITLEASGAFGDYANGYVDNYLSPVLAVFSGPSGFIFPGPESQAMGYVSLPTCPRGIPTDIAQDFYVPNLEATGGRAVVQVPEGATEILFTANNCYFKGTADPNYDFGITVKITVVRGYQIPLD